MATQASLHFQKLVDAGHPVGEVVAINNFLVTLKGLQPVSVQSLVVFEDGSRGFTSEILQDYVKVLRLGTASLRVGSLAVVKEENLTTKVGRDFIGRVISVAGEPLDGKGAIAADTNWPVFNNAPKFYERELLSTQLETGVTMVDTIFPVARGQRMAMLGDSKSGKTTLATQIAINQHKTDQIVVYVMIAKRRSDIDLLLSRLADGGVMQKSVVVISTIFDSLVSSYMAPYVGCAIAEYLWQIQNQDVVVFYDDLTTHAFAYREISLLSGVSPGRDSYPGDIFHTHSTLLERAGKLAVNHKCLTAIPLVLTEGGDISTYLPTNVMSITDGQWILDLGVFRSGLRPAVNVGLSVTRVGAVGQNERQRKQSAMALRLLAEYKKALQLSQFGTEMPILTHKTITSGGQLHELLTQAPNETYGLLGQQMMLDLIFSAETMPGFRIDRMKQVVASVADGAQPDANYEQLLRTLKENSVLTLEDKTK